MRAVLDADVIVSGALSGSGVPARLLLLWLRGHFEFVASEKLLAELERSLAYPKIRARIPAGDAELLMTALRTSAQVVGDPEDVPRVSVDAGDDYLIALARKASAILVSGDRHLLELREQLPVQSPRAFLESLEESLSDDLTDLV